MKTTILLSFCALLSSHIFSQRYHIRPVNIYDCNQYEAIFIGKILSYEKEKDVVRVKFSVEGKFKLANDTKEIELYTFDEIPLGFNSSCDETWLIWANNGGEHLYFNFNQSTGLENFRTYSSEMILKDLVYLQKFVLQADANICETFQYSMMGCIRNSEYVMAEGKLSKGFPHGYWKYFKMNGIVQTEGLYFHGEKWGNWFSYHQNGYIASKSMYWNGREVKKVQYDNSGTLWCFNEECIMWEQHPSVLFPFLFPYEKQGFKRAPVFLE